MFVDSSHACGLITNRSVIGILLCTNKISVQCCVEGQNNLKSYTKHSKLVSTFTSIITIFEHIWGVRKKGFQVSKPTTQLVDNIFFSMKIKQQLTIPQKSDSRLCSVCLENCTHRWWYCGGQEEDHYYCQNPIIIKRTPFIYYYFQDNIIVTNLLLFSYTWK